MTGLLRDRLEEKGWLLADGGTGTNLFALGLAQGEAPELWNIEAPKTVRSHYRSFIDAGAEIILTNSFGGTANRLRLHGAEDRVAEINAAAAHLARQEVAASGRPALVAGSMGPTGDLLEPLGPMTFEEASAAFAAQAEGLAEGGVDLLWIETLSSLDELRAAVTGLSTTGLGYVATLSFDTNGRTMMGVTPEAYAATAAELTLRPLAYGGNCGTGAAELLLVLQGMRDTSARDDILVAKSNCGIPEYRDGAIRYSGTPELMADYACLARDLGVGIIGGCCGTTPGHLRTMRAALENRPRGDPPSREEITGKLGAVSLGASDQAPAASERGGRRRRRR